MTSHSHSFLPSLIPISSSRYNLWSYTLCSFLQFPINFSHKNLRPDLHCCQTQSIVLPQCHVSSITPIFLIIQDTHTHTHIHISIVMFPATRKKSKTFWSCSEHFSKINSLSISRFCNLYSLFMIQYTSSSPPFQNFKQCISQIMFVYDVISPLCL